MKRLMASAMAATVLVGATAQAATFEGRCTVPFDARNTTPMAITAQPGGYDATGTGTCSGRLAGERVRREPVSLTAHVDDERMGCFGGKGTGRIELAFTRAGRVLAIDFQNPVRDVGAILMRGERGGAGAGSFTAWTRTPEQGPGTLQACAAGTLETWRGEWRLLRTREPFVLAGGAKVRVLDGTCDVVGQARSDVPMGVVPVHGGYTFSGRGTCTGTLDGERVESLPVELESRLDDRMLGCASGLATSVSVLRFPSGRPMRLRADHPGPATIVRGDEGGRAIGIFTIITELADHSPEAAAACVDGTQIGEGPMRWKVRTLNPLRG